MLIYKQWKGSNRKQSARWLHVSWLKDSAFCIWQNKLWQFKTQQLILGTGTAIWWVTEPHCLDFLKRAVPLHKKFSLHYFRVSRSNVFRPKVTVPVLSFNWEEWEPFMVEQKKKNGFWSKTFSSRNYIFFIFLPKKKFFGLMASCGRKWIG